MPQTISLDDAQRSIAAILRRYPGTSSQKPERLPEAKIGRISELLAGANKTEWSRVPRIYAVLHMIDKVHIIESFIAADITNLWFPFAQRTLPESSWTASERYNFIQCQDFVLTKALDLEREDGKHRHFATSDEVPLEKLEELGKGGFGKVDRVLSTITYQEYARKCIPRGKTFGRHSEKLKEFERELSNLKKLRHEHVIRLVGSYTDDRLVCILMSPVADCNLKQFLNSALSVGQKSFLRTFYGCLATAVQYLHENQVRHKDIKSQNVLVKNHQVYLTDFGISLDYSTSGQSTTTGESFKTDRYCAPEVAQNLRRNDSSDLWSLGCVFLEILTVLRGETLESLDEHLLHDGNQTICYHANMNAISTWINRLKAKAAYSREDPPLAWVEGTLQVDASCRWSAHKLVACVMDVNDHADILFIGDCCSLGEESTVSDTHSRRNSILEETGATNLEIYEPSQQRMLQSQSFRSEGDNLSDHYEREDRDIAIMDEDLVDHSPSKQRKSNEVHEVTSKGGANSSKFNNPKDILAQVESLNVIGRGKSADQSNIGSHSSSLLLQMDATKVEREPGTAVDHRGSLDESTGESGAHRQSSKQEHVTFGGHSQMQIELRMPDSNTMKLSHDHMFPETLPDHIALTNSTHTAIPHEPTVFLDSQSSTPKSSVIDNGLHRELGLWHPLDERIRAAAVSMAQGLHDEVKALPQDGANSKRMTVSSRVETVIPVRIKNSSLPSTWQHVMSLQGHSGSITSIAFSPQGRILASSSVDGTVKLWDLVHGHVMRSLTGHSSVVNEVVILPDGQTLASGSEDNAIRLWHMSSANHSRALLGHTDTVKALAMSPDGQTLASGSKDHTVKLWDLRSRRCSRTLWDHTDEVCGALSRQMVRDSHQHQWIVQSGYGICDLHIFCTHSPIIKTGLIRLRSHPTVKSLHQDLQIVQFDCIIYEQDLLHVHC